MSKIIRIKAKQRPKDNSIELSFVSNTTDLSRYDVLSNKFYSTLNTAIISYITETYKNTDIDFGTINNPKLHITINTDYSMEDINNHPIAIYTVTTNKSNTEFNGIYYSIIDYDNYSIKKKIITLNELVSDNGISIDVLNRSFPKNDGSTDNKIVDNENNPIADIIHHDQMNNASADKNLAHEIHDFKGIRYSSIATEYTNEIATVKGHIYDTMQSRYISLILDATLRTLMISPENIYLLNIECVNIKHSRSKKKDIARTIKAFIESQDAFCKPGSIFIPFYVDTGSETSKNMIEILIEAGFQGAWSMYMYINEPNSNKVFEELLKMENRK